MVPIYVRVINRDCASLKAIEEAIANDRDCRLESEEQDVRSLGGADVAIVNLDDLAAYDVSRLQLIGAPPGVVLISTSRGALMLESVRARSVSLLFQPLTFREVTSALAAAKDAVLLNRVESLAGLLAAYSRPTSPVSDRAAAQEVPSIDRIEWVEAARNYVRIHTDTGVTTFRLTMADLEAQFRGGPIARCHRKSLVNLERVADLELDSSGGGAQFVLASGKKLAIGRAYRQSVRSQWRDLQNDGRHATRRWAAESLEPEPSRIS